MNILKQLLPCFILASGVINAMEPTSHDKMKVSLETKKSLQFILAKETTRYGNEFLKAKACVMVQQERIKKISGHENFDAIGKIEKEKPDLSVKFSYRIFRGDEEVSLELDAPDLCCLKDMYSYSTQTTMLYAAAKEMRNIK